MMKQLAAVLITAGLAVCSAQTTTPTTGPSLTEVTTYLTLTDSQITSLQAIQQTARLAAQPIVEQIRTKQQELRKLLTSGSTDTAAIGALQVAIQTLQDQVEKINSDARVQAKAVLNATQQTKLAALEAAAALLPTVREAGMLGLITPPAGPDGGFGFGPGGRGGPGGPGGRGRGGPGI